MATSKALEDLKAEMTAAQATLIPIIEGLEDFNRLDIKPETKAIVTAFLAEAKKRQTLLTNAQASLDSLVTDNYPNLDVRVVNEAVYADLAAQKTTIDAALGKFTPKAEVSTVTVVPGTPEPK